MQVEDRRIVETVAATGSNVLETIKNVRSRSERNERYPSPRSP